MGTPDEIPSRYIHIKSTNGLIGCPIEGAPVPFPAQSPIKTRRLSTEFEELCYPG